MKRPREVKPVRTTVEVKEIIAQRLSELREAYRDSYRCIDWDDNYTRMHFASEAGWITASEKALFMKHISDAWLRMRLSEHIPDVEELRTYNRNLLLEQAVTYQIIPREEADRSLLCSMTTVKCYLWTLIDDRAVSSVLREYASICSQITIRGSIIANLVALELYRTDQLAELFSLVKNALSIRQLLLPEYFATHKNVGASPLVSEIVQRYAESIPPVPNWEQCMSRSGWDNALKYIANKFQSAVSRHVRIHLIARCKKYLSAVCNDTNSAKGCFCQGTLDRLDADDLKKVSWLRSFFGNKNGELVDVDDEAIGATFLPIEFRACEWIRYASIGVDERASQSV